MKLIRYKTRSLEKINLGILSQCENKVFKIKESNGLEISDMNILIENSLDDLKVEENGIPLKKIKLLPILEKTKHDIICVGVNYHEHLVETKEKFDNGNFIEPKKTVYFSKRVSSIIGTNQDIEGHFDIDSEIDYEVELGVIIGKKCRNVKKEDAEEYIFGYSIINDISARKLQADHNQWYLGKGLDSFAAMGPCIVHKSALNFPPELDIKSYVNGELRQNSNTKYLIKGIGEIIEEITKGITLEAGDIIATGTPSGVGLGMVPQSFLKKGDEVICTIEKIGDLKNTII